MYSLAAVVAEGSNPEEISLDGDDTVVTGHASNPDEISLGVLLQIKLPNSPCSYYWSEAMHVHVR